MEKQIITRSIKCLKCKYEWMTRTQKMYVSCPNCLQKVKSKINSKEFKRTEELKVKSSTPGNNQINAREDLTK